MRFTNVQLEASALGGQQITIYAAAVILLSLCFVGLLYLYLFIGGIRRYSFSNFLMVSYRRIAGSPDSTRMGKTFYFLIFFIALVRIVAFGIMILQAMLNYQDKYSNNEMLNDIELFFIVLRYLPEAPFFFALAILGWLILTVFLIGLIQLNDYKYIA
jgi:hypothetical protein